MNYQPYQFISYNDYAAPLLATTNIEDTLFMDYSTIFRSARRYAIECSSFELTYPMPDTLCNGLQGDFFFEHGESFITAKGLGYIYAGRGDIYGSSNETLVAFRKNGITYGTFTPDSLLIAGIENSKNTAFYHAFPNPTTGNITLLFDKEDNYHGTIYNVLGEKASSFSLENKKEQVIDLQDFPVGMYYLEVVNSKGKISVQKIIKN